MPALQSPDAVTAIRLPAPLRLPKTPVPQGPLPKDVDARSLHGRGSPQTLTEKKNPPRRGTLLPRRQPDGMPCSACSPSPRKAYRPGTPCPPPVPRLRAPRRYDGRRRSRRPAGYARPWARQRTFSSARRQAGRSPRRSQSRLTCKDHGKCSVLRRERLTQKGDRPKNGRLSESTLRSRRTGGTPVVINPRLACLRWA